MKGVETMTERELNHRLKTAFTHAAPDLLDPILSQRDAQKGTVILMSQPKKKNLRARFAAAAAALALVIGLGAGLGTYRSGHAVAATVSLDVNPSIEIKVNKNEKVLEVIPRNEDAQTVIGTMDFTGSSLEVTVNALIGSMLRSGYLNELANSILVSVDDSDAARGKALEEKLAGEIDTLLHTGAFEGSVLSQTITADTGLDALAEQYGITAGKAQLIRQIITQDTRYSFEDLAPLSINELNLISESGSLQLVDVTATGAASDRAYIGIDAAKQAAKAYFLDQLPVIDAEPGWEWELDYEHGRMVYEIEFTYQNGSEYECTVDALTGEVLSGHHSRENGHGDHHTGSDAPSSSAPSEPSSGTLIGADAARAAALAHAGVSETDAYGWECELDLDRGSYLYEVEFKSGGYEYSYDIDAGTGAVIRYEKERDD